MYKPTYNTEATNEKITAFNESNRWSRLNVTETSYEYFTRDEKNHLAWCAKWCAVAFIVASIATYFINKL